MWDITNAQITVSTNGVIPSTLVSYKVTGLLENATYYFKIWHADNVPNWSDISNTATSWAMGNAGVIVSTGSVSGGNGEYIIGRNMVRDSNGVLYLAYTKTYLSQCRLFVSRSVNNGVSWSDTTSTPIDTQGGSGYAIDDGCLAIDGNDVLHLAYTSNNGASQTNEGVFYTTAAVSGMTWKNPVKMPGAYPYRGFEHAPTIAVASDNSLHMTWYGEDGGFSSNDVIRYAYKSEASSSWNNYSLLPGGGIVGIFSPAFAIDNNNGLHVAFITENALNNYTSYKISYTYKTLSDSTWAPITNIVDFTANSRLQSSPAIAVDSNSIVHVAWTGQDDSNPINYQIKHSSKSITGTSWSDWKNIQTISEAPQSQPAIAVDAVGEIYIVWSGSDSVNNTKNIKVTKYSGGAWSSWINISKGSGDQTHPTIRWSGLHNNEGKLNIAWVSQAGSDYHIRSYTDYSVNMSTGFVSTDITPPTVTILNPANGSNKNSLPVISGIAEDPSLPASGLNSVELRILNMNTVKYWDKISETFSIDAATSSWEVWKATFSSVWIDNVQYQIEARAKDNAGNYSSVYSTAAFLFDSTPPDSTITFPADGGNYALLSTISGIAADSPGSGINKVEICIKRVSDSNYWDNFSWVGAITWINATYFAGSWNYNSSGVVWTNNKNYTINSRAIDGAGNYQVLSSSRTFHITGPADRLLLMLPGETFSEGIAPGKAGKPSPQTAGVSFNITAMALDSNYYLDTSTNSHVTVITDDVYDTEPAPADLAGGTKTFTTTLKTATTIQISIFAPNLLPDTTNVYVNPATASKLQILAPGENSIPGSPTGKTGTLNTQTAGVTFTIKTNLVDNYWNKVSLNAPDVQIVTDDPYDTHPASITLSAGTAVFNVTLLKATTSGWNITALDIDGISPLYSSAVSTGILVNADIGTKLLVLVPGESYAPGSSTGKTDIPQSQTSGQPFMVTVLATDNWYNLQKVSNPILNIMTTDPDDTDYTNLIIMVNGQGSFSHSFVKTGNWTLNAQDAASVLIPYISSAINVLDGIPPASISNLTALAGTEHASVKLEWTAPGDNGNIGNITGGQCIIRYSSGGQITDLSSPPSPYYEIIISSDIVAGSYQSHIVTGLPSWTTYYFAICTLDASLNSSSWSVSGVNTLNSARPPDKMNPIVTNNQPQDNTWRKTNPGTIYDVDFNDGYSGLDNIQYCAYSGTNLTGTQQISWTNIALAIASSSYSTDWSVDFSLLAEATNYISVKAFDLAGNSTEYIDVFYILKDTTPPSISSLSIPADNDTKANPVYFDWTDSTDALSGMSLSNRYTLQISSDPDNFETTILESTDTVNSDFTLSLSSGSRWWRVKSKDNADNYSDWSSTRCINIGAVPSVPSSFVAAAVSTTSIKWLWTDVNGETGYNFYFATGTYIPLPADTTYYIVSGLSPNYSLSFYIKAYNISGEGNASSVVSRYTLADTPSNPVSLAQTPSTIKLEWIAGSGGNTRYYIERSIDGINFTTVVAWANNLTDTSYTDLGLLTNTTYFYKIGGYNGDGILSGLSGMLSAKTAYVPPQIISGYVTQSNKTAITGVEVTAIKAGANPTYTVYTTTAGFYQFTLESLSAEGLYKIKASWTANGIQSSVYKEDISNGTENVNFTLETNYDLATVSGKVIIARSTSQAIKRAAGMDTSAPGFVELLQNGKVIGRIYTDLDGNYEIPNILPGKYTMRAFNGLAYSKSNSVELREGDRASMVFSYDLLSQEKVYSYPNPAVSAEFLTIHFETSGQDADIELNIYTISGELVRTVKPEEMALTNNVYEYQWNMKNQNNQKVASGVYIYQVKVKDKKTSERANVIKKLAIVK